MLQASSWGFQDYPGSSSGAVGVDPKRPYGNSYGIEHDIAEVIGNKPEFDKEDYLKLHRETKTALEVILQCKTFKPGDYMLTNGGWKPELPS